MTSQLYEFETNISTSLENWLNRADRSAAMEYEGGYPDPEINSPMPRSGPGHYSYQPAKRQYGLVQTIEALKTIGRAWSLIYPGGPRIAIGDLSKKGGGHFPPHKSHQKGLDADIKPVRGDGKEGPTTFKEPSYSRAMTQRLVELIHANGVLKVQVIYFNDPDVKGVRKWPGHNDHLHIRFYPPGNSPKTSVTPKIQAVEKHPPLMTIYQTLTLGGEAPAKPLSGIFIPEGYRPTQSIDLILYLRGHHKENPTESINRYWNKQVHPYFALREGLNSSGKNVILIAPTLGPTSQAGWLAHAGGLDRYLQSLFGILFELPLFKKNYLKPRLGNLIIACHSGGGSPMVQIALSKQSSARHIRQCWGFDSLYGEGAEKAWKAWALSNPSSQFYLYYGNGNTYHRAKTLGNFGMPNIFVEGSLKLAHNLVPITYWQTRLKAASFLQNK